MNRLITILLFTTLSIGANAQLTDVISSLDDPTSIAVYGDELYISEDRKVIKIDLTDPTPTPVDVFTGFFGGSNLLIDGDDLYIAIYTGGKVVKMNLSTDNPTPVDVVTNVYGPTGMSLKGDILYVAEATENKISKVDLSEDNPMATDFITGLDFPNALLIEGNDLYFIEVGADKISKVDLSEAQPSPVEILTDLDAPSMGLLLLGEELYFSQYRGDKISKININDIEPIVTDVFTDLNGPTQLLQKEDELYIAVTLENKVSKINNVTSTTTSITDRISKSPISLFPNPTSNSILIEGLDRIQTGTLFNATGAKILDFIARENQVLNLQNLDVGMYYLVLENGWAQKVVKK